MIASLLAPLSGEFGAASALQLVLIGGAAGAAGVWALQFGQAILAESFTHALLPGLVAASLLGAGLAFGAVLGVIAAAIVIGLATRAPQTNHTTAISSAVTLMIGVGALMAATGNGIDGFEALLFGDPLTASKTDLVLAGALAATISLLLVVLHQPFTALAFDPTAAASLGLRVWLIAAAALVVLALTVSVTASVAGSLLALALVLGPAYGAINVCSRIATTIGLAAAVGAGAGVVGIYLSWYANWPASASVALVVCAWAGGAAAFGGLTRRGLPVG